MELKTWLVDFIPEKTLSPQSAQKELARLGSDALECKKSIEWQVKHLWIRIRHPHYNSKESISVIDDWKSCLSNLTNVHQELYPMIFQMGAWGMYERAQFEQFANNLLLEKSSSLPFKFKEIILQHRRPFISEEYWKEISWVALWKANQIIAAPWRCIHVWHSWPQEWIIHLADPINHEHGDFGFVRQQLLQSTEGLNLNDLPDCLKIEWEAILKAKN